MRSRTRLLLPVRESLPSWALSWALWPSCAGPCWRCCYVCTSALWPPRLTAQRRSACSTATAAAYLALIYITTPRWATGAAVQAQALAPRVGTMTTARHWYPSHWWGLWGARSPSLPARSSREASTYSSTWAQDAGGAQPTSAASHSTMTTRCARQIPCHPLSHSPHRI